MSYIAIVAEQKLNCQMLQLGLNIQWWHNIINKLSTLFKYLILLNVNMLIVENVPI